MNKSLASGYITHPRTPLYRVEPPNDGDYRPATTLGYMSLFNPNVATQTVLVYLKRKDQDPVQIRRIVLTHNQHADLFTDGGPTLSTGDSIEASATREETVYFFLSGDET